MEQDIQLPDGWKWANLNEACQVILGQSPSSETYNTEKLGLPFYQGKTEFGKLYPTPVKWCTSPTKIAEAGDVLISVRAPVGPTNLCQETSCIGRGLAALRPKNGMPNSYLLFYLRFIESEWDSKATGTTFKAITGNVLGNQKIPIPPLPEQERIVAKIEALFSQLDAGVATLRRIQAALKRYKASVLKAACEGRLSVQDPADEPAEALLRRLGKTPLEDEDLPTLPEGWEWVTVEEASESIVDCLHSTAKFVSEGRYCIDTNCIEPGKILFEKARFVDENTYNDRIRRLKPIAGDILFSREGTIGTAVIVPENIELCLGQRMMMFRPSKIINSSFLLWVLLSDIFERQWKPKIIGTTAPHINIGDIRQMTLPIPPMLEQHRIVAEIERRLSVAVESEAIITTLLARSARLRQAILKQAFEGKLV